MKKLTRRTLIRTLSLGGSALVFVPVGFGRMDQDGTSVTRCRNRDAAEATIFLYGRAEIPTASVQGLTDEQLERLIDRELQGMKQDFLRFYRRGAARLAAGDRKGWTHLVGQKSETFRGRY